MTKKLHKLINCLRKYANLDTTNAAKFLLIVFENNYFFELDENIQKKILDNLLSYFDFIVYNEKTRKVNKHITQDDIKAHITYKVYNMCNYPKSLY